MAEIINLINQETAVIGDGLPYKVVRNSIPNASYLGTKGDLFVGTGVSNDVIIGEDTYKLTKMGKLSVPTEKGDASAPLTYVLVADPSVDPLSESPNVSWKAKPAFLEVTNNKIQFIKDCLKLDNISDPDGMRGIVAGDMAIASGEGTIAIGKEASIGASTTSGAYENSIAIGSYAQAAGNYSVVMGSNAISNGSYNIVIGAESGSSNYTHAEGNTAIVIGMGASSDSNDTITIGMNSKSTGSTHGVLIGTQNSSIEGLSGVVVGANINQGSDYGVAIGADIKMAGDSSVCLATSSRGRNGSNISGDYSIGIGQDVTVSSTSSIAIGNQSSVSGRTTIAIGSLSQASGPFGISLGLSTLASGDNSIAIGSALQDDKVMATGASAIAIGTNAKATGASAIAIGMDAKSKGGIQLGNDTSKDGGATEGLKVYKYQLMDGRGYIPNERILYGVEDVTMDETTVAAASQNYLIISGNNARIVYICKLKPGINAVSAPIKIGTIPKAYAPIDGLTRVVRQCYINGKEGNSWSCKTVTAVLNVKVTGDIYYRECIYTTGYIESSQYDDALQYCQFEVSWLFNRT